MDKSKGYICRYCRTEEELPMCRGSFDTTQMPQLQCILYNEMIEKRRKELYEKFSHLKSRLSETDYNKLVDVELRRELQNE